MTDHVVSEEVLRLAVDACPSGMIITDAGGKIVLANAEIERLFGYPRAELLGQSIEILVPDDLREAHRGHRVDFVAHPSARRTAGGRELYGRRKDGTAVAVEIGLSTIATDSGPMILGAVTATLTRTLTDETFRAIINDVKLADERFCRVVEAGASGMILTDADGRIVLVNGEAERLFGYRREELFGRSIEVLLPAGVRDRHREYIKEFVAHAQTRRMARDRELHGVRKDGTQVQVEISLNPVQADGTLVLSAITDISVQKQAAELQRSNTDLEQFAYVASHDLQEPLRMVLSYTELLGEHLGDKLDDKARKYMSYSMDGAKRMQRLVQDLLAYSRVDTQGRKPLPVKSEIVLKNVLQSLKVAIDESRAEIVCGPLPPVRADGVQLGQVFQNLLGNALKFRRDQPPRIEVDAAPDDDKWLFRVADNGIGIDRQYSERVFQMFQRLHERGAYDGSGIGLAITKKIVERHGGRIWFDSEPGKGSTFYFTMPAVNGDVV